MQKLDHDHENIVKLFLAVDNYIVMEFCDLGNFEKYLEKQPKSCLDDRNTHYFMRQLFLGLEYLHDNGIVHRDLKPPNLLLQSPKVGQGIVLKIADFGLAKENNDLINFQTFCGTRFYMAPEVTIGNNIYDFKVDIWSSGVIFFRTLTGKLF